MENKFFLKFERFDAYIKVWFQGETSIQLSIVSIAFSIQLVWNMPLTEVNHVIFDLISLFFISTVLPHYM